MSDPAPRRRPRHAERTRAEILELAVRLGAREGLEALTIGRLATEIGMSKGGLFAHFGSKENLQLATVEAAYEQFAREVMGAALDASPGRERLQRLLDAYFDYVRSREATGGCFFTAASVEFDDRPGPVRDRIAELVGQRNAVIAASLEEAVGAGQLPPGVDVPQLTFEIVAVTLGANVEFQLSKDPSVFVRARAFLEARLQALCP